MSNKYILKTTSEYRRKVSKINKKDKGLSERLKIAMKILAEDPFSIRLRTHVIANTDWGRVYSSRINGDVRILWAFDGKKIILLYTIGRHSGNSKVYK
jgi:mRNA-degrading endonuclease YafQ of YafQ-DinJ toxin-antitoxin module